MRVNNHSAEHVSGTSTEIAQRNIIRDNIVLWQRQRRRRAQVIEKKSFVLHFNSVGDAFAGKRVGV